MNLSLVYCYTVVTIRRANKQILIYTSILTTLCDLSDYFVYLSISFDSLSQCHHRNLSDVSTCFFLPLLFLEVLHFNSVNSELLPLHRVTDVRVTKPQVTWPRTTNSLLGMVEIDSKWLQLEWRTDSEDSQRRSAVALLENVPANSIFCWFFSCIYLPVVFPCL